MTVADAVALAGGATSDGKIDKVELRRAGRTLMVDLGTRTRLSTTPVQSGDQLFVPQKSWTSRNTGLVAAGITAMTTVVVTLLVR
jgi:protein involved in polysaccharide export with SLBB domain